MRVCCQKRRQTSSLSDDGVGCIHQMVHGALLLIHLLIMIFIIKATPTSTIRSSLSQLRSLTTLYCSNQLCDRAVQNPAHSCEYFSYDFLGGSFGCSYADVYMG